jgi:5-methylcytosine-specific restriction endonuclease McrA
MSTIFTKVCRDPRCRKTFTTTSRKQAYCTPECRNRHYKECKKRRKKYTKVEKEARLVARSYGVAQEIAAIFYPDKICAVCGKKATHVHHIDVNVFNNDPSNLMRVCDKCHKQLHTKLPSINIVEALNECASLKKENPQVNTVKMWRAKFGDTPKGDYYV